MITYEVEETRAAWNEISAGYDKFVTPTHMWLANEGLRRAGLQAGMYFLDVAAGSGALSIPAARQGAQVLSTDIAPGMLERLQMRARQEGLNLETRVMDGHALELEDNTFDVSGSQFGVMLFPDMPRGISELARVIKPGGRVLMNVYGNPEQIEFLGFFVHAIQSVVPSFTGPPTDQVDLPFQLANPEKLHQELANAGLKEIRVETITERLEFHSAQQMWNWLTNSNPIAGMILAGLNLTIEQTGEVHQALEEMLRARAGGNGSAILTNPIHIGVGTK
jgi:ubiquinone/menaquinone biosynthesis C-methylase UbiE